MGKAVILAGDFNCPNTNLNGKRLDAFIDDLAFEIVGPPARTHFPYNNAHRPSTIDLTLLKNVTLRLRSIEVMSQLNSDH